jgi:predicted deacetylase
VTGRALVSVHDVMPATLDRVLRILALLDEARVPPPTLLVVPGKDWTPETLRILRKLTAKGHPLAGHGWYHKSLQGPRSLYHRLHGLLISRNEAEHLSRPPEELADLIRRCYDWFPSVDLPAPELYVPPTWALGALRRSHLKSLPFTWYEILRGFVEGQTGRTRWLPLAGFEADTTFRKVSVRLWNNLNVGLAKQLRGPIRISIHPDDLDLFLRADLKRMVRSPWRFIRESDVLRPSPRLGSS